MKKCYVFYMVIMLSLQRVFSSENGVSDMVNRIVQAGQRAYQIERLDAELDQFKCRVSSLLVFLTVIENPELHMRKNDVGRLLQDVVHFKRYHHRKL